MKQKTSAVTLNLFLGLLECRQEMPKRVRHDALRFSLLSIITLCTEIKMTLLAFGFADFQFGKREKFQTAFIFSFSNSTNFKVAGQYSIFCL